jgi:MFS family permease
MATATVVARIAVGIPFGRLADRVGRKRVIYLVTPLWYAANILLILSPNAVTLVLSAVLQVFYSLSSGITSAMTLELVPLEEQGRWSGILGFFSGALTIPAPVLGGLIWQELGPAWVFVIPVVFDILVRLPLLSMVPETLKA